jgi:hypothetical protein
MLKSINLKSKFTWLVILILATVCVGSYMYFFPSKNEGFRKYENGIEYMDWKSLDEKYKFSTYGGVDEVRAEANRLRNKKNLSEDERFYLNYLYHMQNFKTDPLEKIDFLLKASENEHLTSETNALAAFSLVRVVNAYPEKEQQLMDIIGENIRYGAVSTYSNFDDKRIVLLDAMYNTYPTNDNTVFLLFYLVNRYENTESPSERENIKKKIISIDFPIDEDMYPYIKHNKEYGRGYRTIVELTYLQTIIKLERQQILDKEKYIEKYISHLETLEKPISSMQNQEYFKSNFYYTYALYYLYKKRW